MNKFHSKWCNERYPHCGRHPSLKQHERWMQLDLLERAGVISDLQEEVAINLLPAVKIGGRQKPAVKYVADFTYIENGVPVVEDVKSSVTSTTVFRLKQHLLALKGIQVRIT